MNRDATWQRVVAEIPTHHLPPDSPLAQYVFGARATLSYYARTAKSVRYLEVGCRLGHSLAMVALSAKNLERAVAIDLWIDNYGDEPNSGAQSVYSRLEALGIDRSPIEIMTGDSHLILPNIMGTFNLIFVDGDHTAKGAAADLNDAIRLLEPGGLLVFDDAVPELLAVWREVAAEWPSVGTLESLDDNPPWCGAFRFSRSIDTQRELVAEDRRILEDNLWELLVE